MYKYYQMFKLHLR